MVEADDRYCEEQRIRHLDRRNELGLSMAFIRESTDFAKDDLTVFPPINHENLYIDGFGRDRESPSESSSLTSSSRLSDSSSSSSLSPSETDGKSPPSVSHLRVESPPSDSSRWKSLYYYSTLEIDIIQVMVIVIWWWMRKRARRRLCKGEVEAHLRNTIKERDERIAQLLHQIAQMNELLVNKKHLN